MRFSMRIPVNKPWDASHVAHRASEYAANAGCASRIYRKRDGCYIVMMEWFHCRCRMRPAVPIVVTIQPLGGLAKVSVQGPSLLWRCAWTALLLAVCWPVSLLCGIHILEQHRFIRGLRGAVVEDDQQA